MTDQEKAVYQTGYSLFRVPTDPAKLAQLHTAVRRVRDAGILSAKDIGDWFCDGIFDSIMDLLEPLKASESAVSDLSQLASPVLTPAETKSAAKPSAKTTPAVPLRVTPAARKPTANPAANTRKTRKQSAA